MSNKNIIGVYKITSPSNKTYIGQSININNRWEKYYKKFHCKNQIKLYNSLIKYGYNNHKFEILEECNENQLLLKENYYKQLELDKVDGNWQKVLFCRFDGKGGKDSEETRIKKKKPKPKGFGNTLSNNKIRSKNISNAKKGTKGYPKGINRTNDIKLKIGIGNSKPKSQNFINYLKNNQSRKEKIRNSRLGKNNKPLKPILKLDINLKIIEKYKSITESAKLNNINPGRITTLCKNNKLYNKLFYFKYDK